MADALHEGHQGRQSWAEKARLPHRVGQGRRMELSTAIAPISQRLVFADDGRGGNDFHLLLHVGRIGRRAERAAAIGAAIERIGHEVVDGLVGKRRPQVLFMARLSATFAFFAVLARRLGRLDDITGRRLGGSRRVLAGRRQLAFELLVFLPQAFVLFFQQPKPCSCRSQFLFRRSQFLFQRGKAVRQRLAFRTLARFPQDHGAVRYQPHTIRTRSADGRATPKIPRKPDATLSPRRPVTIILTVSP